MKKPEQPRNEVENSCAFGKDTIPDFLVQRKKGIKWGIQNGKKKKNQTNHTLRDFINAYNHPPPPNTTFKKTYTSVTKKPCPK